MNDQIPETGTAGIFSHPFVLFTLLLLAPFIIAWLFRERRLHAADPASFPSFRFVLSGVFFWIFAALSLVALAGPRWGIQYAEDNYRGLDVVLALDVSRSMEVKDVSGERPEGESERVSRLEHGAALALKAVSACGGIRFGAAAGRGRGVFAVPLTWDNEAINGFLESLSGASISGKGTNLESLIDAASEAFESGFPSRRTIVLVSDGEALTGSLPGALHRAEEKDISVTVLAVGTEEGGPVPGLYDEDKGPVYSRRRQDALRYAAQRTGGIFIDGNRRDAAALLSGHLLSLAPGLSAETGGERRTETKSRQDFFVILALLAFGASKVCVLRRRGRFLLAASLFVLFTSCSRLPGTLFVMEGNMYNSRGRYTEASAAYLRALEYEDAVPYAEYGLGLLCLALDKGDAALEHFASAGKALEKLTDNRELVYRLRYNRGVALFGKGDYAAAAAAFREALQVDGGRIAAKRNLELSLLSGREDGGEKNGQGTGSGSSKEDAADGGPETAALFDYMRQREREQWKSREWPDEENFSGPDY
jgi:Ca-activated chloride channel family protein